jgi:hypothetical protein
MLQSMTVASGMLGFFDRVKQGIVAAGRNGNAEISEEVISHLRFFCSIKSILIPLAICFHFHCSYSAFFQQLCSNSNCV